MITVFNDNLIKRFLFILSLRTRSLLWSSWITSTLTWWKSLASCFLAKFLISFVTISIWMSLMNSGVLIYQGSSKYVVLKSLNDVSVALFRVPSKLYAVGPHRHQYLYSVSLLCIDRADLIPVSQYILFYFSPSFRVFFLTCTFQRNLASSVMPRYFTVLEWGMILSFIVKDILDKTPTHALFYSTLY